METIIWLWLTLLKIRAYYKSGTGVRREGAYRSRWAIKLLINCLNPIWIRILLCNRIGWWSTTHLLDCRSEATLIFVSFTQINQMPTWPQMITLTRWTILIRSLETSRTLPATSNSEWWCPIMTTSWLWEIQINRQTWTLTRKKIFRLRKCGIMTTVILFTQRKTKPSEALPT